MSGRREANKRDKQRRIIEAARKLFLEKGFERTTTSEIAITANVAAGTVFTYAATKEELLIQVFHSEMSQSIRTALPKALERSGLTERTIGFLEAFIVYFERDLPLGRALMRELGFVRTQAQREKVEDMFDLTQIGLIEILRRAQIEGEISPDVSLPAAASNIFAIFYLYLGPYLSGMLDRGQYDRQLRSGLEALAAGF
jgi:AcrR family transcriptional regulator